MREKWFEGETFIEGLPAWGRLRLNDIEQGVTAQRQVSRRFYSAVKRVEQWI